MDLAGLSALGQCSWQLWWEWQAWQPPSAASAAKRPRAIERSGSQIILVPTHGVAGCVTHGAIDAFDGGVGGHAPRGGRGNPLDGIAARLAGRKCALGPLPLGKELGHVTGEVLDDGHVGEWPDLDA